MRASECPFGHFSNLTGDFPLNRMAAGFVAALVSIGLDFLLIPRFGAVGAAVANTTVQGLWALTISAPLWKRLIAGTTRAIGKTAFLALVLAAILFVLASSYPLTVPALFAGGLLLIAYGVSLHRLHLLRVSELRLFS